MAYKQATIKLLLMQGENKAKLDNVKTVAQKNKRKEKEERKGVKGWEYNRNCSTVR